MRLRLSAVNPRYRFTAADDGNDGAAGRGRKRRKPLKFLGNR